MGKNAEIVTNLTYIKDGVELQFDVEKAQRKLDQMVLDKSMVKYVYCVHDKDTYTKEDEAAGKGKAGELKKPHVHIFISLKNGRTFEDIGKWFGLNANFVNKCETQFNNACLYAVHANAPEKYQYPVSAAVASAGFDYQDLVITAQKQYQKNQNGKKSENRRNEIINLIANGQITRLNLSKHVTALEEALYERHIKAAFARRDRELALDPNRKMEGVYICGGAGTGKTTLAKTLAEVNNFSVGISGSDKDPVQNYYGQECYILDDLSPDTFRWKELLKIADNNTSSAVKSRYRDKSFSNCKLLFITNVLDPRDFVELVPGSSGEEKKQFYRRFKTLIKFVGDLIITYVYDEELNQYIKKDEKKNLTSEYVEHIKKQEKEKGTVEINYSLDDAFNSLMEKDHVPLLDLQKYDIVDGVRIAVRSEPTPTVEESTTTEIPDGLEEVAPAEDLFDWS